MLSARKYDYRHPIGTNEDSAYDGIPYKEIAETTGVPVPTLLSRKHYAIGHLRKRLQQLYREIVAR